MQSVDSSTTSYNAHVASQAFPHHPSSDAIIHSGKETRKVGNKGSGREGMRGKKKEGRARKSKKGKEGRKKERKKRRG